MKTNRIDKKDTHRFELVVDSHVVSWLTIIDYAMTYESSVLTMGGIAGVGTDDKHRYRGYARTLLNEAIEWMDREGYHCSFLFGIPDFYWRFGYATVLSKPVTSVLVRTAETADPLEAEISPMDETDIPEVRELYNANMTRRRGGLLRASTWSGFGKGSSWNSKPNGLVVRSAQGEFLGYAVYDGNVPEVRICELETSTPMVFPNLLRFFTERAIASREREITYLGPTDHPFAVYLRQFGAVHTDDVQYNQEGMARIFNLESTLQATAGTLAQRSRVLPAHTNTTIGLSTDVGAVCLQVSQGRVEVSSASTAKPDTQICCKQSDLSRLLFGVWGYSHFCLASNTTVDYDVALIMSTLFPEGLMAMCPTDWF